jgi:radical SAM protein with 4Fe4S-binding SPASM domain
MGKALRGTTTVGFINRKQQKVIRDTGKAGTHNQRLYELQCQECRFTYLCNGCDIYQHRCPKHDGGRRGL